MPTPPSGATPPRLGRRIPGSTVNAADASVSVPALVIFGGSEGCGRSPCGRNERTLWLGFPFRIWRVALRPMHADVNADLGVGITLAIQLQASFIKAGASPPL